MVRAQFGLSTLIILIAIIVTAAVAAGVIIYTASSLQSKALQTGAAS
ncbi:archaellin/type IV pilin N-terminal domain-containing protein [Candidatus Nanopusillus massiliensis]|nr:archaellin/type IV pilin N-terminal domain-containing protein [Candidatus Nanopusillus massiliensis]